MSRAIIFFTLLCLVPLAMIIGASREHRRANKKEK